MTLDDIADVYYPLVLERPYLCAFFFPILIFISIGLMNLVTAALVENETWFMNVHDFYGIGLYLISISQELYNFAHLFEIP